jgi:hypothetical protein
MRQISNGSVYRRADSESWYIQFSIDGELKRESSGTCDRDEAIAFLQRRIDEARHGRYVDIDRRPTFADLERLLLENYEFKRNRTDPRRHVRRLAEMFGGMKAEDITEVRIREYSRKRLKHDGMTPATLRRELALLKRMLRLAAGSLPRVPLVDCRGWTTLARGSSRKRTSRPSCRTYLLMLETWSSSSISPRAARPGRPGRLLHDFRRTAVRNLIRAGVQQAIAMKITGHKTDSIFRRYLIVDEELLAQATGAVAQYLDEARRNPDRPTS